MLTVSFDFDENTKTVTNVKVVKIPSKYDNVDIPLIELGENKLIFSPKALELMNVGINDRITVNYITQNNETIPIIGKSSMFADPEGGNKLTRNNTISFKGMQHDVLNKYGQLFRIDALENQGLYKMSPINDQIINNN